MYLFVSLMEPSPISSKQILTNYPSHSISNYKKPIITTTSPNYKSTAKVSDTFKNVSADDEIRGKPKNVKWKKRLDPNPTNTSQGSLKSFRFKYTLLLLFVVVVVFFLLCVLLFLVRQQSLYVDRAVHAVTSWCSREHQHGSSRVSFIFVFTLLVGFLCSAQSLCDCGFSVCCGLSMCWSLE